MARIIEVDFKKKKKVFSFDDEAEARIQMLNNLSIDLKKSLDVIVHLSGDNKDFQMHCAKTLAGIVNNLRYNL